MQRFVRRDGSPGCRAALFRHSRRTSFITEPNHPVLQHTGDDAANEASLVIRSDHPVLQPEQSADPALVRLITRSDHPVLQHKHRASKTLSRLITRSDHPVLQPLRTEPRVGKRFRHLNRMKKTSAFLLRRPRAGGSPSVSRISTGVSSLSNRGTLAFACKLYVTAPVPFTQRTASARFVEAGCVLECEAGTPQRSGQRFHRFKAGLLSEGLPASSVSRIAVRCFRSFLTGKYPMIPMTVDKMLRIASTVFASMVRPPKR